MIETCRSIFKSFNVNNLSVCIGWCADQVTLRSARCNGKDLNICLKTEEKLQNLGRDGSLYSILHLVFPTKACSVLCEVRPESSYVT